MSRSDIYFMPLGGGQRVGASCYFLRLGSSNLILDAGTGMEDTVIFEPDTYSLITSPFIQSLNQINQIYISHAHSDHVGYLPKLLKSAQMCSVYMTEMTSILSEYQLYDRNYIHTKAYKGKEKERLAMKYLLQQTVTVSYMQTIQCGQYQVTFLPAGHIPGATMLLFEYQNRKILYTGDFSLTHTPLTDGCMIPEYEGIDTIILCGLHAKHPHYRKKSNTIYKTIRDIFEWVKKRRKPIFCRVQQLSKGIEFLKLLNKWNETNNLKVDIYIDDSILKIVKKIEQLSVPIMTEYNHPVHDRIINQPHILISAKNNYNFSLEYEVVKINFSLHEDFSGMEEFIKRINPKLAVFVHCAPEYEQGEDTIEQRLMTDIECRTQCIFAEEKEIYKL